MEPKSSSRTATTAEQTAGSSAQLSVSSVRALLVQARTHYREGRFDRTVELAAEIAAAEVGEPEGHALAGSAAVLTGLCARWAGTDDGGAFTQALAELREAPEEIAYQRDYIGDLGIALALTADADQAEPVLREALRLGTDTIDVRRCLGVVVDRLGRPIEARGMLRHVARYTPDDWQTAEELAGVIERSSTDPQAVAEAWAGAGRALDRAGRYRAAIAAYRRAVKHAGRDASFLTELGVACANGGELAEALDALRLSDRLDPRTDVKVVMAQVLAQQNDLVGALAELDAAVAREPDHRRARLARAELLRAADRPDEAVRVTAELVAERADLEALVAHGLALLDRDEPGDAVEVFGRAARLDPDNVVVLRNLALAMLREHDTDAAVPTIERALELEPDNPATLLLDADIQLQRGHPENALSDLRKVVSLVPTYAAAWGYLGDMLRRQGALDEALASYEHSLAIDDNQPSMWLGRADVLIAQHSFVAARDAYQHALDLAPDLVDAMIGLAEATLDAGTVDGSDGVVRILELTERAIAHDPERASSYVLRGEAYRRSRQYQAAEEALDQAIRLDPTNAYALGTRGQVRSATGRLDEAVADLERAATLDPGASWIRAEAGRAYHERGDRDGTDGSGSDGDRALEHLSAAVDLQPDDTYAQTVLAIVLQERGDLEAAEIHLRRALETAPEEVDLLTNLARILYLRAQLAEALHLAGHACTLAPADPDARLIRGKVYAELKLYDESVADYEAAIATQPDFAAAHAALGDVYRVLGRYPEALTQFDLARAGTADAWTTGGRGATLLALGRTEEAMTDLRDSLAANPHDAFVFGQLRDGLLATSTADEALQSVAEHAERYPDDLDLQEVYAETLGLVGRHEDSLDAIDEILWRRPDRPQLLRLLSWAHLGLGHESEALAAMERAAAASPDDPFMLADLATVQSHVGELGLALATIDRAMAVQPSRTLLVARSQIRAELGDWPGAAEAAEHAVKLPPAEASAYQALGWALEHVGAGQPAAALAAYREAVRLAPDDPWARRGVADTLWYLGRTEEAATEYERALDEFRRAAGTDPSCEREVGWCLYRLGRHLDAAEMYLRVSAVAPADRASLLFDIGLNWLAANDTDRAGDAYAQGFAAIGGDRKVEVRSMLEVSARDLREALAVGQILDTEQSRDLLHRLADEAAGRSATPTQAG